MAQRGGELAAKAAKPSGDAAGEDRLSALPDDLLVLILLHLDDTAEAIRTSYFSRRWRRVWTLLPVLRFDLLPEVNGVAIRRILDAPEEAAPLRWISVTTLDAGPESAAAWLPVAARRLSGELNYHNLRVKMNDRDDEDLQLPCFEKATTIKLDIGFLGLALPPHGIFGRLTELFLWRVRFRSPSDLGGVVSSPRCPCLKKLEVSNSRGLQDLSIHSESLVRLKLEVVRGLRHLTIMAPILQKLGVVRCILAHDSTESVANISAPQLVDLDWKDFYDPQYVHLGDFEELQQVAPFYFVAYGPPDIRDKNQYCLSLLQRFQALYCLHLTLMYRQNMWRFMNSQ
nr:unnamed protein product [Digitaria exilis]